MEVYYAAKNAAAFQALAEEVHGSVDDRSAALWDKAVQMGASLCPGHELFRDATAAAEDDFSDLEGIAELDELEASFTNAPAADAETLDIEEMAAAPELTTTEAIEEPAEDELALDIDDLSLDFDTSATAEEELTAELEETPAEAESGLELEPVPEAAAEPAEEAGVDFGELTLEVDEEPAAPAPAEEAAAGEIDFDLDEALDMDLEPAAEKEEAVVEEPVADIGLDEVATKLDLAKAYIDMGDPDGARAILDEVINEGNDTQKTEAQELIAQL